MTTKAQVIKLAAELGVIVEHVSNVYDWDTTLDAPPGYLMEASRAHCCVIHEPSGAYPKATHWDAVYADLACGVIECDYSDCDVCDANDEAWRRTNDAAWELVTKR